MLYFAKLENSVGFFDDTVNHTIPANAVEISPEQWHGLLAAEASGKKISADAGGYPIVVEREETPEQLRMSKNATARAYLTSTDWYVIRNIETGVAIPEDILKAREAARQSVTE